jgi:hypothetical protein
MRAAVFPGSGTELESLGYELIHVRSSSEQRKLALEVDLLISSPDNLYAWAAAGDPPLRVLAGGHVPGLALYEGPSRSGALAVDAPMSGFAFLARALDGDRRPTVAVGATPARAQALRSGEAGAALLHPPFTDGLQRVADVADVFPAYQSMVVATGRSDLPDAGRLRAAFGTVSAAGLRAVWELRQRYAPAACPDDWRLPAA